MRVSFDKTAMCLAMATLVSLAFSFERLDSFGTSDDDIISSSVALATSQSDLSLHSVISGNNLALWVHDIEFSTKVVLIRHHFAANGPMSRRIGLYDAGIVLVSF